MLWESDYRMRVLFTQNYVLMFRNKTYLFSHAKELQQNVMLFNKNIIFIPIIRFSLSLYDYKDFK